MLGVWIKNENVTGAVFHLQGHLHEPTHLAFGANSALALSTDRVRSICWDLAKRQERSAWDLEDSSFSPVGIGQPEPGMPVLIALTSASGYRIETRDMATGSITESVLKGSQPLSCFALSPDGRKKLAATKSGDVFIWKTFGDHRLQHFTLDSPAQCAAFSYDARMVVFGCSDGVVRLCVGEGNSPRLFRTLSKGVPSEIIAVGLNRGGTKILAAEKGLAEAAVWDLASGEERLVSLQWQSSLLKAAAIGSWDIDVALAGYHDGTVALWDLQTGKRVVEYRQHAGPIAQVALSRDGRWALSAGERDFNLWLYRLPALGKP